MCVYYSFFIIATLVFKLRKHEIKSVTTAFVMNQYRESSLCRLFFLSLWNNKQLFKKLYHCLTIILHHIKPNIPNSYFLIKYTEESLYSGTHHTWLHWLLNTSTEVKFTCKDQAINQLEIQNKVISTKATLSFWAVITIHYHVT